jgi:hypothetical protein
MQGWRQPRAWPTERHRRLAALLIAACRDLPPSVVRAWARCRPIPSGSACMRRRRRSAASRVPPEFSGGMRAGLEPVGGAYGRLVSGPSPSGLRYGASPATANESLRRSWRWNWGADAPIGLPLRPHCAVAALGTHAGGEHTSGGGGGGGPKSPAMVLLPMMPGVVVTTDGDEARNCSSSSSDTIISQQGWALRSIIAIIMPRLMPRRGGAPPPPRARARAAM